MTIACMMSGLYRVVSGFRRTCHVRLKADTTSEVRLRLLLLLRRRRSRRTDRLCWTWRRRLLWRRLLRWLPRWGSRRRHFDGQRQRERTRASAAADDVAVAPDAERTEIFFGQVE